MAKKVLMLHGYTQNAKIFSARLGAIRRACKSVEMMFVDAPIIVPMPTENESSRAAFDSATDNIAEDPEMIPRAWWNADPQNDGTRKYRGVDESLQFLSEVLQKDEFVGVFGFSQGAAMAALLTAILENPSQHPAFAKIQPPLPKFKYSIFVAGFRSVDPRHDEIFRPKIQGRTLHVLGRADNIVSDERTQSLVKACNNPRVEFHEGGHHVPSKAPWRKFFETYIDTDGDENTGSPSRSGTPGPEEQGVPSFGRL